MKKMFRLAIALLALAVCQPSANVKAQGTAFTYQGRLSSGTTGVTGLFDFRFAAFDTASSGSQVGSTVNLTAVGVTNGLFTVTLDFGANVFSGPARFLDLAARTNGSGATFVSMTPRQALTPTPYALLAASASSLAGTFSGDVTGTQGATLVQSVAGYSGAVLVSGAAAANAAGSQNYPGTIVKRDGLGNFSAGNMNGSFTGNGAGITNLPTTSLAGTISGSQIAAGAVGASQLNASAPSSGQVLSYNGSALAWTFPAGSAGANTFTNQLTVGTTSGQFTILGENGTALGISGTGGPNPGHIRFRNALEIFPATNGSAAGYLDVRNTNGAGTVALHGDTGVVNASNVTTVADITLGGKLAMNAGGAGTLTLQGENGQSVAINATGGSNPGHIRLRNALEIQPSADNSSPGSLDVRNASGNTTITMDGGSGAVNAGSITTSGDVTTTGGKLAMNSSSGNLTIQGEGGVAVAIGATGGLSSGHIRVRNALEIQPSADHSSAGYLDVRNTNGNATISMDGGSGSISANGNVSISGNLSANNTPGVNYAQSSNEAIPVTTAGPVMICSEGNAKPAPGFFIINGYVTGDFQGNYVYLDLCDVSGATPVVIAGVRQKASIGTFDFYNANTLNISWVVPITNANGYQNFGLRVTSSGDDTKIYGHNLTVLFVPRQNN